MIHTAVVILNWNGRKHLEQFLPSVIQHTPQQVDIVVADNGSTDDSVEFLRREYRSGHSVFTLRRLLAQLRMQGFEEIRYTKLKFIIRIMQELLVCGVTETDTDHYVFEFYDSTAKTNIEKSSIF